MTVGQLRVYLHVVRKCLILFIVFEIFRIIWFIGFSFFVNFAFILRDIRNPKAICQFQSFRKSRIQIFNPTVHLGRIIKKFIFLYGPQTKGKRVFEYLIVWVITNSTMFHTLMFRAQFFCKLTLHISVLSHCCWSLLSRCVSC